MDRQQILSKSLMRLRKARGLTQNELAVQLGVTSQAVSKWERGASTPDAVLLPAIAAALNTSTDALFGYAEQTRQKNPYTKWHESDLNYKAFKPSQLALDILSLYPSVNNPRVLHVSCGKGHDTLFLARNGYNVTAFDYSDKAVEDCRKLLSDNGLNANVFCADMNDFRADNEYDIVFSTGVLHWTPPDKRQEIFECYKEHTSSGGFNLWNAFVQKPFIDAAPDLEPGFVDFYTGELFRYYHDWKVHKMDEIIYDCNSRGTAHKHCLDILIAEKAE